MIVEFPSMEAAKAWYDGPEYRAAREHPLQKRRLSGVHITETL